LLDSEDLIARTTIVGIIIAFRKCMLEALNCVLSYRIPFLLSSIADFKKNIPDKSSSVSVARFYLYLFTFDLIFPSQFF